LIDTRLFPVRFRVIVDRFGIGRHLHARFVINRGVAEIVDNRGIHRCNNLGTLEQDSAIGPLDPAIAGLGFRFAKDQQPPLKTVFCGQRFDRLFQAVDERFVNTNCQVPYVAQGGETFGNQTHDLVVGVVCQRKACNLFGNRRTQDHRVGLDALQVAIDQRDHLVGCFAHTLRLQGQLFMHFILCVLLPLGKPALIGRRFRILQFLQVNFQIHLRNFFLYLFLGHDHHFRRRRGKVIVEEKSYRCTHHIAA